MDFFAIFSAFEVAFPYLCTGSHNFVFCLDNVKENFSQKLKMAKATVITYWSLLSKAFWYQLVRSVLPLPSQLPDYRNVQIKMLSLQAIEIASV